MITAGIREHPWLDALGPLGLQVRSWSHLCGMCGYSSPQVYKVFRQLTSTFPLQRARTASPKETETESGPLRAVHLSRHKRRMCAIFSGHEWGSTRACAGRRARTTRSTCPTCRARHTRSLLKLYCISVFLSSYTSILGDI